MDGSEDLGFAREGVLRENGNVVSFRGKEQVQPAGAKPASSSKSIGDKPKGVWKTISGSFYVKGK